MARDFIYIDSSRVKERIMDVLEMTEGDLSGNKLGLSSKVVPVVCLNPCPDMQADTHYDVTAVQNTWYTVFKHTGPMRVYMCSLAMETLAEDLEFRLTVDGVTWNGAQAAAVAGSYYWVFYDGFAMYGVTASSGPIGNGSNGGMFLDCNEFKFEMRKTNANGANNLHGNVTVAYF